MFPFFPPLRRRGRSEESFVPIETRFRCSPLRRSLRPDRQRVSLPPAAARTSRRGGGSQRRRRTESSPQNRQAIHAAKRHDRIGREPVHSVRRVRIGRGVWSCHFHFLAAAVAFNNLATAIALGRVLLVAMRATPMRVVLTDCGFDLVVIVDVGGCLTHAQTPITIQSTAAISGHAVYFFARFFSAISRSALSAAL